MQLEHVDPGKEMMPEHSNKKFSQNSETICHYLVIQNSICNQCMNIEIIKKKDFNIFQNGLKEKKKKKVNMEFAEKDKNRERNENVGPFHQDHHHHH